jgi:hypothetical protein
VVEEVVEAAAEGETKPAAEADEAFEMAGVEEDDPITVDEKAAEIEAVTRAVEEIEAAIEEAAVTAAEADLVAEEAEDPI